jgi:hypothetical protein
LIVYSYIGRLHARPSTRCWFAETLRGLGSRDSDSPSAQPASSLAEGTPIISAAAGEDPRLREAAALVAALHGTCSASSAASARVGDAQKINRAVAQAAAERILALVVAGASKEESAGGGTGDASALVAQLRRGVPTGARPQAMQLHDVENGLRY